jgi:hypothetical protein
VGSRENCCAHCPDDRPTHVHARPRPSPRTLGGPAVPIVLGAGVLGAIALAAVFWNLIAGLILGVPVAGWLLVQIWGEIELEWECRRPVQAVQSMERVNQDLPARRLAVEAPRPRVPIIAQAEVIEVRR